MSGGSKVPLEQRIVDIDRHVRKNETFTIHDLSLFVKTGNRIYSTRELTRAVEIMCRRGLLAKGTETMKGWPMKGRTRTIYVKISDLQDLQGIG